MELPIIILKEKTASKKKRLLDCLPIKNYGNYFLCVESEPDIFEDESPDIILEEESLDIDEDDVVESVVAGAGVDIMLESELIVDVESLVVLSVVELSLQATKNAETASAKNIFFIFN